MLPTATSSRPSNSVGNSAYLELENHLHFKSGERKFSFETVLYCRRPESDKPQGLMDRLLAPLRSALSAVRAWRAKNWVINYVESNFNGAEPARTFLQSVRAEGKVRRDDFLCLLLADKLQPLSGRRQQTTDMNDSASLNTDSRNAVLGGLVRQELVAGKFSGDQVNAFVSYMLVGRVSEPHEKDLWEFVNNFKDKTQVDNSNRLLNLLKPKVLELGLALQDIELQREREARHENSTATVLVQGSTTQTSTAPYREVLADQLQEIWAAEGGGLAGMPHVKNQRSVFIRYLRNGLSGMNADDLRDLGTYAKNVRDHEIFQFPAALHQSPDSVLETHFNTALDEIKRLQISLPPRLDIKPLSSALAAIIVSSKLNREQRLHWSSVTRSLLEFAKTGTLPEDAEKLLSLRSLVDKDYGASFMAIRRLDILLTHEEEQLYEVIKKLDAVLKAADEQKAQNVGKQVGDA